MKVKENAKDFDFDFDFDFEDKISSTVSASL